ncbi:MAG TPA: hypothetical protein VEL08_01965 [Chthoniobacterales bacterium]|nr:hypothetical protein [Chthoniobacterales bacterium]
MSREEGKQALFQRELAKVEIVAELRHALDLQYRRLCEAARADWERLFRGKDPADACVRVRVAAIPSSTTRGSGFLKSRKQPVSKSGAKASLPRFAH